MRIKFTVWHSSWGAQESFLVRLEVHIPFNPMVLPVSMDPPLSVHEERLMDANYIGNTNLKMALL